MKKMMEKVLQVSALAGLVALAGCFTVSETEPVASAMSGLAPAVTNHSVVIRGFEAALTEFVRVYGYDTVYVPGHPHPWGWGPGYVSTVQTTTDIPQLRATDRFLELAKDRFEQAGFITAASTPDYIVEVKFTGPYAKGSNVQSLRFLKNVLSIFLYDDDEATWSARLKVYDNHTGQLLLNRDYVQTYEVSVFSPIPLFGIACYDRTEGNYEQCWCLNALTIRTTADASAFIAAQK